MVGATRPTQLSNAYSPSILSNNLRVEFALRKLTCLKESSAESILIAGIRFRPAVAAVADCGVAHATQQPWHRQERSLLNFILDFSLVLSRATQHSQSLSFMIQSARIRGVLALEKLR
jgi:hypothetical protein